MPKHTETINRAILGRSVHKYFESPAYRSFEAYQLCIKHNDPIYEYAARAYTEWKGAESMMDWIAMLPKEINGHVIDYGIGPNSLMHTNPDLFLDEEVLDEYNRWHRVNKHHKNQANSKGGKKVFDNCQIITACSNKCIQDLETKEDRIYALKLALKEVQAE